MKYEVAGDPVSGLRWTRKTTKKIAAELSALGIRVSRKTVAKLLKQMNFSLRTNKKKISNGSPPTEVPISTNEGFDYKHLYFIALHDFQVASF